MMTMLDTIFFYIVALLTLAGAVLTITRRSAVHSAISLIVSLLGVAGLYLLQRAEFLFAVQIVLYIAANAKVVTPHIRRGVRRCN